METGELLAQTSSNSLGQRCVLSHILWDLQSGDARGAGALPSPRAPAGLNQERGTGLPEESRLSECTQLLHSYLRHLQKLCKRTQLVSKRLVFGNDTRLGVRVAVISSPRG